MGQRTLIEQRRWFGVCRWYEGYSGGGVMGGNPRNPLIRVIRDSDKRMTADWMSGGCGECRWDEGHSGGGVVGGIRAFP